MRASSRALLSILILSLLGIAVSIPLILLMLCDGNVVVHVFGQRYGFVSLKGTLFWAGGGRSIQLAFADWANVAYFCGGALALALVCSIILRALGTGHGEVPARRGLQMRVNTAQLD